MPRHLAFLLGAMLFFANVASAAQYVYLGLERDDQPQKMLIVAGQQDRQGQVLVYFPFRSLAQGHNGANVSEDTVAQMVELAEKSLPATTALVETVETTHFKVSMLPTYIAVATESFPPATPPHLFPEDASDGFYTFTVQGKAETSGQGTISIQVVDRPEKFIRVIAGSMPAEFGNEDAARFFSWLGSRFGTRRFSFHHTADLPSAYRRTMFDLEEVTGITWKFSVSTGYFDLTESRPGFGMSIDGGALMGFVAPLVDPVQSEVRQFDFQSPQSSGAWIAVGFPYLAAYNEAFRQRHWDGDGIERHRRYADLIRANNASGSLNISLGKVHPQDAEFVATAIRETMGAPNAAVLMTRHALDIRPTSLRDELVDEVVQRLIVAKAKAPRSTRVGLGLLLMSKFRPLAMSEYEAWLTNLGPRVPTKLTKMLVLLAHLDLDADHVAAIVNDPRYDAGLGMMDEYSAPRHMARALASLHRSLGHARALELLGSDVAKVRSRINPASLFEIACLHPYEDMSEAFREALTLSRDPKRSVKTSFEMALYYDLPIASLQLFIDEGRARFKDVTPRRLLTEVAADRSHEQAFAALLATQGFTPEKLATWAEAKPGRRGVAAYVGAPFRWLRRCLGIFSGQ